MKREVFLFVSRNMGSGYANAYPVCGPLFAQWCDRVLLPKARADFVHAVAAHSAVRTSDGGIQQIEHVTRAFGRYVWSMRRVPDTKCTDPLAAGRMPKFEMQVVFDGKPNLFCKAFNDCLVECRRRGWDTMEPGANTALRFEAPPELFAD